MRTPLEACGASFRVESIAMESFDLESAGAHARSFFDAGPGHCMVNETFEPAQAIKANGIGHLHTFQGA
jgi:hypothetical protein